jgi:predicted transcriptional regulator
MTRADLEQAVAEYRQAKTVLAGARARLVLQVREAVARGEVSKSEVARLLGVSRQAVQKMISNDEEG